MAKRRWILNLKNHQYVIWDDDNKGRLLSLVDDTAIDLDKSNPDHLILIKKTIREGEEVFTAPKAISVSPPPKEKKPEFSLVVIV